MSFSLLTTTVCHGSCCGRRSGRLPELRGHRCGQLCSECVRKKIILVLFHFGFIIIQLLGPCHLTYIRSYNAYGAGAGSGVSAGTSGASAASSQKPAASSASIWTEHKTDDGITYWYNCSTGVSQVYCNFAIIFP